MASGKRPTYIPPHLRLDSSAGPSVIPSVANSREPTASVPPYLRGTDSSLVSTRFHPSSSIGNKSIRMNEKAQDTPDHNPANRLSSLDNEQPQPLKLTHSNLLAARLGDPDDFRADRRQKGTDSAFSANITSERRSLASASTAKLPQPTGTIWPKPQDRPIGQAKYLEQPTKPSTLANKSRLQEESPGLPGNSIKTHRCTFEGCSAAYDTFKRLKIHKKDRHYYCGLCDIDFKDDNDHLLHKIGSDRHIVCPVCSADFSTSAGRDRHFKLVSPFFLDGWHCSTKER